MLTAFCCIELEPFGAAALGDTDDEVFILQKQDKNMSFAFLRDPISFLFSEDVFCSDLCRLVWFVLLYFIFLFFAEKMGFLQPKSKSSSQLYTEIFVPVTSAVGWWLSQGRERWQLWMQHTAKRMCEKMCCTVKYLWRVPSSLGPAASTCLDCPFGAHGTCLLSEVPCGDALCGFLVLFRK